MASSLKKLGLVFQVQEFLSVAPDHFKLFFAGKGSGNNTYQERAISGTSFLKGSDSFHFYVAHALQKHVQWFLGQRDLEKFMPLEHSKYFVPEILYQSKKKRTCFFLRIMCGSKTWMFSSHVFHFLCFFSGVYHCVSPYFPSIAGYSIP